MDVISGHDLESAFVARDTIQCVEQARQATIFVFFATTAAAAASGVAVSVTAGVVLLPLQVS